MPRPKPDQSVFDAQVFTSQETFEEARCRMKQMHADKEGSGYLQSHQIRGQSQRLFQNMSPISKGREKWVPELGMSTGNLSPTSIKVFKN